MPITIFPHPKSFVFAMQFLCLFFCCSLSCEPVMPGIDVFIKEGHISRLKNKKIGLITNQTAVNSELCSTLDLLKQHAKEYQVVAIFAPEHGFYGRDRAAQEVDQDLDIDGIPIYSLHGKTRRPTEEMLKGIDLLIYDIQDVGARTYTYITTLFYVMEAAAKKKIPVIVMDRPNPINGVTIDGPMLEEQVRSMVGYINIPYCYGMTVGELAQLFNKEYKVGCNLEVIPMKGWMRSMTYRDTGLPWIPTSPYIPESDTPLYYPMTGILGEISVVNIGVGYTLPFKLIGAPWINAMEFAKTLNSHRYPGVYFTPFYFRPFYGKYKNDNCEGVLITVSNHLRFKPLTTQFLIIETLKKLYPIPFKAAVELSFGKQEMFSKVVGSKKVWEHLLNKRSFVLEMRNLHEEERKKFYETRKKYLIPSYAG